MSQQPISPYSESFVFDWSQFAPRQGLICLPAIAIVVLGSVFLQHPVAATVAGGGAVSVGFGSFQRIKDARLWPMLLASLGMFLSALVGTMAGYSSFILMIVAGIWGFSYGMLAAIGGGAAWAGLQCVIAMLVASGYPQTFEHALLRALLILGAGFSKPSRSCCCTESRHRRIPTAITPQIRSAVRVPTDMPYASRSVLPCVSNLSATFPFQTATGLP